MAKSYNSIINLFKKKYDLKITFDHFSLGDKTLDILSDSLGRKVMGQDRIDETTLNLIKETKDKHPDIPIFYNYLYISYIKNNQDDKASVLVDEVIKKFPTYIFGFIQKASKFIQKNEIDKARQLMGNEMNIKTTFPKDIYHVSEIKNFYHVFFLIAIKEENPDKAKEILNILWELSLEEDDVLSLAYQYQTLSWSKKIIFKHTYTNTKDVKRTKFRVIEEAYDQAIFDLLYNITFMQQYQKLFDYETKYVCEELYKICVSIYKNIDLDSEDDISLIREAFGLLAAVDYMEAFPLFVAFISFEKEVVEYFWDNDGVNIIDIAFNFGKNNPSVLLDLFREDVLEDFIRTDIFGVLIQLVLHGYLENAVLIKEYNLFLDKILKSAANNEFVPTFLLTLTVSKALDLNDRALLEKSRPLFDVGKIDTAFNGTYDDHETKLVEWELQYVKKHHPKDWKDYLSGEYKKLDKDKPISFDEREKILSFVNDPFESFLFKSLGNIMNRGEKPEKSSHDSNQRLYEVHRPIVKDDKIGRNDPCPCGSGKKYKKCCLNS
jgi:hypothetical protein